MFERLSSDVDAIAALTGMQDVFRLRAADIYRVVDVAVVAANPAAASPEVVAGPAPDATAIAEMCARINRCGDLDALVSATVNGLDRVLGYRHVHLLMLDEEGRKLYTLASRGYDEQGIGSEVAVGDGAIGVAAERATPVRVGNLGQMAKYSRSVRRAWEADGSVGPGPDLPLPGLPGAESMLAVPAAALGQVLGVVVAESAAKIAFSEKDEAALQVVASLFASAYESLRVAEQAVDRAADAAEPGGGANRHERGDGGRPVALRYYAADGSTFLDGDYLIKGVAGRILWSLVRQHAEQGRVDFTNRELRLDPSLEMPGFKDNLESRLILLTRRLEERDAPIRLVKTGRGRFHLEVRAALAPEAAAG